MKKTLLQLKHGVLIAFSMLFMNVNSAFGQTEVQIGTGTSNTSVSPINSCFGYTYSQQIYLASELNAEGINNGLISRVSFYYSVAAPTGNSNNWEIYVGTTDQENFPNNTSWVPFNQIEQVYAGIVTFPPSAGEWMDIEFDNPFVWDGQQNLVIAVREIQPGWNCTMQWHSTNVGTNRTIHYRSDSVNPNPSSPPTAFGLTNFRPNVKLEITPLPECAGIPETQTISSSSNATGICLGDSFTLTADNNNGAVDGLSFQWEQLNAGTWTPIVGATSLSLTITDLEENSEYRIVSACSFSSQTSTSSSIEIVVNELPEISLNAETYAFCPSESAVMTASGAESYMWLPATGLNNTTGAMVGASPSAITNYTVTGTDVNGCIGTAEAVVYPISLVNTSFSYSPDENCEANTPITIEVTGAPESVSGMGTWEYLWLEADGTTEALAWNSLNEFTFVPQQDGVYTYFYKLRSTSCPSAESNPTKVTINVGFGVEDANLVHVDCNVSEGSISLVNPFGQSDLAVFYSNNFDTSIGANTTTHGVANLADGRMVITPSAGNSQGGFTIESTGANVTGDMNVSYLMTVDLPINNFGTGGADGLTYSFGDDANYTNPGGPVNGKGTKLRVSFDSANNGTENGNTSGIYVVYGWTANNAFGPASAQTLAYSNNTTLWKNMTDVPVNIAIDESGLLTLTVGGEIVFEDIQLPQEFVDADKSNWKHLFSAGTGGDANRHAIDDLNITYGSLNFGISAENAGIPTDWQTTGNFSGLAPGIYNIWISNPADVTCSKLIATYEILNNYPVVALGNDTTICAGTTITLDAGNPGSTYTWSNSNQLTQTIQVSQAGTYVCYLTNPDGCLGIGSIQVSIAGTPSADGILIQGSGLNQLFVVVNPQNTTTYDWDFGDGTTVQNGGSVQNHSYAIDGDYVVTVAMNNAFDCEEIVISQNVTVVDGSVSIENNTLMNGLSVYPNPATDFVIIKSNDLIMNTIELFNISGQMIARLEVNGFETTINTSDLPKGAYFVQVRNEADVTVKKLIIQ